MQTKPAASLLISSGELRRQKHFICSRLGALALSSSYAWGSAQLTGKQRLKLCSLTISDSPKHQLWVEKAWCGFGCLFKVLALLLGRCKFFYISVSVLWKKINEQLLLETSTLSHIWKLFMQIVSKVIRSLKTKREMSWQRGKAIRTIKQANEKLFATAFQISFKLIILKENFIFRSVFRKTLQKAKSIPIKRER